MKKRKMKTAEIATADPLRTDRGREGVRSAISNEGRKMGKWREDKWRDGRRESGRFVLSSECCLIPGGVTLGPERVSSMQIFGFLARKGTFDPD
jgi:hypothetical protein